MNCASFLDFLRKIGLAICNVCIDFIRSEKVVEIVDKIAKAFTDFSYAFIEFLREVIDNYVN